MTPDVIYYGESELVSEADAQRIERLFGKTDLKRCQLHRTCMDNSVGTGLHPVIQVMLFMWNDRRLNERYNKLMERIASKKTLTRSSSYYSESVEHNLMDTLVSDTITAYNREQDPEDAMKYRDAPYPELCRIFGLPYKDSIVKKLDKYDALVATVPDQLPEVTYEFEFADWSSPKACKFEYETAYKEYHLKPTKALASVGHIINERKGAYSRFPFLGKLYYASPYSGTNSQPHIQVYVYDNHESDRALQHVLHALSQQRFSNSLF